MDWIPAILAISALIVVHEAGHYVVARLCGMRVERFSIGFGPAIVSWKSKKTGTQFQIAPIPFGGFVEIKGMNIVEEVDPNDASAYPNRPAWQRFLTIFAGPATNYLFAVVLAFCLFTFGGMQTGDPPRVVDSTVAEAPADGVLQPGDEITAINGQPLDGQMSTAVNAVGDQPAVFTVKRNGQLVDLTMQPRRDLLFEDTDLNDFKDQDTRDAIEAARNNTSRRLGIMLKEPRASVGVGTAAYESLIYPGRQTKVILSGLYEWITGKTEGRVSSVVGITQAAKEQIDEGWIATVGFLMVLNVYLGLFNLFPLPALDGGRLVFLVYEMVTRRRANPKLEATIHMVGVLVLAVLLVVVTVNDFRHL